MLYFLARLVLAAILVAANLSAHASVRKPEQPIQQSINKAEKNSGGQPVAQGAEEIAAALDMVIKWLFSFGDWIQRNNGAISLIFAAAVAGFTLLLAKRTSGLWEATKDVADAAKQSAETAERALVSLEGPALWVVDASPKIFPENVADRMYPGNAPPPMVDIFLYNTGRSTAIIQRLRQEMFILPGDLVNPEFNERSEWREGITVTAKDTKTRAFPCVFHRSLTGDEISAIRAHNLIVYALGEIIYDDDLGYRSKYCYFLRFNPAAEGGGQFAAKDSKHNYHKRERLPETD